MPTSAGVCGILRCGTSAIDQTFGRMREHLRGKQPIETALSDWYCVASSGYNSSGVERGCVTSTVDFALGFEGRIDNRRSLLEFLSLPQQTTNANLLAAGFARLGSAFVQRLVGAFVVILVHHADRRMSIWNDHLALRPLYYANDATGNFLFASDPRQILPVLPNSIEINRPKLCEHLSPVYLNDEGWIDFSSTLFTHVSRLPHATELTVDATGVVRSRQYWHPPSRLLRKWRTAEQCADEFGSLFRDVLKDQLDTANQAGAELSGGIDSGCLVSVAADLLQRTGRSSVGINTYTLTFATPSLSAETEYVHAIATRWPQLTPGFIEADGLSGILEFGPYHEFRNVAHPARLNLPEAFVALAQRAAGDGCELLFSGEGADWFLEGSDVVWDSLIRAGQWREVFRRVGIMKSRGRVTTLIRYLTSYALRPLLPLGLSRREFVREYYSATWHSHIPDLFYGEFVGELTQRLRYQLDLLQRKPSFECWSQRLEHELLFPPNHGWQGIPIDVELRLPYLDRRIIEFALTVPPEYKFRLSSSAKSHYGARKFLQRWAFRDLVPSEVIQRQTKATYGLPVVRRLADNLARVFSADDECHLSNLRVVDCRKLRRVLPELSHLAEDDPLIPWLDGILGLEAWLRALSQDYGNYS